MQQPVARQLLHHDVALDARQPPQLLRDDLGLQQTLAAAGHVLPVAPTAPTRNRNRARRNDSIRRRLHHLDGVRPPERPRPILGDRDDNPLTRQRMPYEHHAPLMPRDAVPTMRHRPDSDLEGAHRRPA